MNSDATSLPAGPLLAWYGDDFTGSAAVMEVLQFAGLNSVLFLGIPTAEQRTRFSGMRGIGIAGTARSHSPSWMREHLPACFQYLKSLNAPVSLYKVCSTLDSSPQIGSIGAAIDIAQPVFNSPWIPMYAAAPAMRRYQAFGHFFAGAPGGVFRLDRHPVMARHPVTPMTESDVNRHLALQTDRPSGLIDLESMSSVQAASERLNQIRQAGAEIVAIDTVGSAELEVAGALIWADATGNNNGLFAVGSQGVAYALVAHWQACGWLPIAEAREGAGEVEQIIVVSGSVSPTTQRQIAWAEKNGFAPVALNAADVARGDPGAATAIGQAVSAASAVIRDGNSPMVFTARGPDDPAVEQLRRTLVAEGIEAETANQRIGESLGKIVGQLLRSSDLNRVVIAGGDTSGHAMAQLSVYALTALAPTIPGAALFQAHAESAELDGLQLALKGGQMGSDNFFEWIRLGGGRRRKP